MLGEDAAVIFVCRSAVSGHVGQRLQLRQARKKPLQLLARQNRPHHSLPIDRRVDCAVVIIRAQAVIRAVFVQARDLQLSCFLDPAYTFYAINNIFPD